MVQPPVVSNDQAASVLVGSGTINSSLPTTNYQLQTPVVAAPPPVAPTPPPPTPIYTQVAQPVAVVQPTPVTVAPPVAHSRLRPLLGPALFLFGVALVAYSVRLGSITGGSMEPTLHEGQHLVIDALTWRFTGVHRGDVLVFTNPHDRTTVEVKRVIGLPGESVLIEGGTIGVTPLGGRYEEFPQGTDIGGHGDIANFTIQLGVEDFFVLGDNRPKSTDSRDFGGVQAVDIIGRVIASF